VGILRRNQCSTTTTTATTTATTATNTTNTILLCLLLLLLLLCCAATCIASSLHAALLPLFWKKFLQYGTAASLQLFLMIVLSCVEMKAGTRGLAQKAKWDILPSHKKQNETSHEKVE